MLTYRMSRLFINQKGTSLIEVLVSFFIVLLIFQLTYIIVFSTSQVVQSRKNTSASFYAVSLTEAVRTQGLEVGFYQAGENYLGVTTPEGMEAMISVTQIDEYPYLALVRTTVVWLEGIQSHQLVLESIVRRSLY